MGRGWRGSGVRRREKDRARWSAREIHVRRCGRLKRITFDISIGQSGFLLDIRRGIIADSCRKALHAPRCY